MEKTKSGFTIVEILIVIVVIAILAAITIVVYNGIQRRAQAIAVVHGLKTTSGSFKLWATEQGFSRWPYDNCSGCGIDINTNIQSPDAPWNTLKGYIQKAPVLSGFGNQPWSYDNDGVAGTGDDKTACSATEALKLTGVNIYIRWINQSQNDIVKMVNDTFDGPNEGATWDDCGLLRYYWDSALAPNGGVLMYSISYTKDIQQ